MMTRQVSRLGLALALAVGLCAAASAQELTIGLSGNVTSADPHFHNLSPNNNVAAHVFDRLVHQDAQQRIGPGLAVAWQAIDAGVAAMARAREMCR